jgi:hypothetical protein
MDICKIVFEDDTMCMSGEALSYLAKTWTKLKVRSVVENFNTNLNFSVLYFSSLIALMSWNAKQGDKMEFMQLLKSLMTNYL